MILIMWANKKGGPGNILNGVELRAWHRFHGMLNLQDSFQHTTRHLWYNWHSKRKHRHDPMVQSKPISGDRVLKRLDRAYSSFSPQRRAFVIKSFIFPGFGLSDHAPVIATISYSGFKKRPSLYRLKKLIHKVQKQPTTDLGLSSGRG